ncbi:AraC family transcriptional regulator [Marinomonas agarivorans]|nr:AraC family transcriptional regulator [Marinomonas agarivorans]
MKKVTLGETHIQGLSIRTNNATEMQPELGKIGGLYHTFGLQVVVDYDAGANLYGVYYQYDSDHNGDFSVLVGSTPDKLTTTARLESVTLQAGEYLVFSGKGSMPQAVIDLWGAIWAYFSDNETEYKRTYTTDFERYIGVDAVEIYIAIQPEA